MATAHELRRRVSVDADDAVDGDDIDAIMEKAKLRAQARRDRTVLWRDPLRVLYHFAFVVRDYAVW